MKKLSEVLKPEIVPLPFQKECIVYALNHHYSINACAQGLGKSLMAISIALMNGYKTLVVCPSYLKFTWQNEIEKFSKDFVSVSVWGPKNKHVAEGFTIVSYETATKYKTTLFRDFQYIIFEEAHYIKNVYAARTAAAVTLVKENKPQRVVLLTGTPLSNRVSEFYSLLALCSMNPLKTSGANVRTYYPTFEEFANYFCHSTTFEKNGNERTKYFGIKNKDKLDELLKGKFIRYVDDGSLGLPELTYKFIDINIKSRNQEEEDLMYKEYTMNMGPISTRKAKSALSKTPHTFEYCMDLLDEGERPLLIYSDHVIPVDDLYFRFIKEGLKVRTIKGNTPMPTRDMIVKQFERGELDVLVATIGALSTGVTLVQSCNVIFNDSSWEPGKTAQAVKRIHRIGQTKRCIAHFIVGTKTDKILTKQSLEKEETISIALQNNEHSAIKDEEFNL